MCQWRIWHSEKLVKTKKLKLKGSWKIQTYRKTSFYRLSGRWESPTLFFFYGGALVLEVPPPRIMSVFASLLVEQLNLLLRDRFFISACMLPLCKRWRRRLSLPVDGVLCHPHACRKPACKFWVSLQHQSPIAHTNTSEALSGPNHTPSQNEAPLHKEQHRSWTLITSRRSETSQTTYHKTVALSKPCKRSSHDTQAAKQHKQASHTWRM